MFVCKTPSVFIFLFSTAGEWKGLMCVSWRECVGRDDWAPLGALKISQFTFISEARLCQLTGLQSALELQASHGAGPQLPTSLLTHTHKHEQTLLHCCSTLLWVHPRNGAETPVISSLASPFPLSSLVLSTNQWPWIAQWPTPPWQGRNYSVITTEEQNFNYNINIFFSSRLYHLYFN